MIKVIRKLWAAVYDLLLYIEGNSSKSLDEIHAELDLIEIMCRPFSQDVEDPDPED